MLGAFISTTIYDKACRRFSVCVESALCDIVAGLLSSATTARCRRQSSRVYQEGCVLLLLLVFLRPFAVAVFDVIARYLLYSLRTTSLRRLSFFHCYYSFFDHDNGKWKGAFVMANSLSGLCSDGWESEDADGCSLPLVSPLLLWSFYSPISLRLFFEALREQCGKIGSTVERLRFSNVVVLLLGYLVFPLKKKKKNTVFNLSPPFNTLQ